MIKKRRFIYPRKLEKNKMTLIIGFKCDEGVVIVSDRKVVDNSNNETWEDKMNFKTFQDNDVIFASAGYAHLFDRFNRRILGIVEENIRITNLNNFKKLKEVGLEDSFIRIDEKTKKPKKVKGNISKSKKKEEVDLGNKKIPIEPPYSYTTNNFIDDCRNLVRDLCEKGEEQENSLEVLLALFNGEESTLHYIDSDGDEVEIRDCYAIGSGSVYVNHILRKFYRPNLSIEDLIKLGYFCIFYVQKLNMDKFVGVEDGALPDNSLITDNGKLLEYDPNEKEKLIASLNNQIKKLDELLDKVLHEF